MSAAEGFPTRDDDCLSLEATAALECLEAEPLASMGPDELTEDALACVPGDYRDDVRCMVAFEARLFSESPEASTGELPHDAPQCARF